MAEPSYALSIRIPARLKEAMDILRGNESQNEYIVSAVAERIAGELDRRTQDMEAKATAEGERA